MEKYSDNKIFVWLIVILAALAAIASYLPMGSYGPQQLTPEQMAVPKWQIALANAGTVLVFYSLLGWIGLKLSHKLGFAKMWDEKVTNKQRFLIPALIGAAAGIFVIIGDFIFARFNGIGHFPHPPFPTSLVASATAGIGEEILFRLFFVSFWMWLVSFVIFRKKFQNQIFWIVAIISGAAFGIAHLPALMVMTELSSAAQVPVALWAELILLNGVVGVLAAYYFRKYGFLAAVGIHFWCDVIWHVIRGLI